MQTMCKNTPSTNIDQPSGPVADVTLVVPSTHALVRGHREEVGKRTPIFFFFSGPRVVFAGLWFGS
jgi:hypothetical protein